MRQRRDEHGLDEIDRKILSVLQVDCKMPLARVGEQVGLSAPSVVERVRKLEQEGFIRGYHAHLDARRLGLGVTAFIGVWVANNGLNSFEQSLPELGDVLECHHVTGGPSLLLKVKTRSTETLQNLIRTLRALPGVERTETNVVLSTMVERSGIGESVLGAAAERHSIVRQAEGS